MSYFDRFPKRIKKANPYHDEEGKFTSADGAVSPGAGAERDPEKIIRDDAFLSRLGMNASLNYFPNGRRVAVQGLVDLYGYNAKPTLLSKDDLDKYLKDN